MVRSLFFLICTIILTSCDTVDFKGLFVPTGDSVDSRFEQSISLNNNQAVATIEAEDSYLFYVCTDPHIDDSYRNLRNFSTLLRNDSTALFGIVLGDCIERRNAMPNYVEAIEYIQDIQTYNTLIFSLIGNHDLYFNGWEDYYRLLGASVYWFEVKFSTGSDLFISLDSANGTLGKRQLNWLREFLAAERNKYRHCIIFTHNNLFYTDNSQTGSGNMPLEETAVLTDLFSRYNVTACFQGHDHYREDLMFSGVRYTVIGTIRDDSASPEFLMVRMSNNGTDYQWVKL